jgi:hypothetical protein
MHIDMKDDYNAELRFQERLTREAGMTIEAVDFGLFGYYAIVTYQGQSYARVGHATAAEAVEDARTYALEVAGIKAGQP